MSTQAPVKPKPTWQQKVETFAAMHGPLTRRWDDYRSFRIVEGFLEVTWPAMKSKVPPLIEMDDKPRCACCGSARPMFLYILKDRNAMTHMVGQECLLALSAMKQIHHTDFVSPIPQPNSEDKAG
jgi:hypothetical protein